MGKKVYVGNISFKATEDDIRELFTKFGEIESVKIITDGQTGRPKGFGFVEMTSEEATEKAITALNGTVFMERTLSVAEAKPQEPREKRGFGDRKSGFGGGAGSGNRKPERGRNRR